MVFGTALADERAIENAIYVLVENVVAVAFGGESVIDGLEESGDGNLIGDELNTQHIYPKSFKAHFI